MDQKKPIVFKHKLSTLFAELSSYVENKAFPDHSKKLLREEDISDRNWIYKTSYKLSNPLSAKEINSPFFFIFWFLISVFQYFYFALGFLLTYYTLSNAWDFSSKNQNSNIFIILLFIVFGIISNMICYVWWFEKLKSSFFKWWRKLIIIIFASLLTLSITYYGIQKIIPLYNQPINPNTSRIIISFLIVAYSIYPSLSYFLSIITDSVITSYLLIHIIVGNFVSLIDPRKTQLIDQLVDEDIPSSEDNTKSWRVSSLSKTEINSLHQWAIANQESSEKQTIPVFLFIAFLGILFTSKPIQALIDVVVAYFITSCKSFIDPIQLWPFELNSVLSKVFVFTIILITLFFFRDLFSLFRNIVTQSINIEICVLAKHNIDVQEKQKSFLDKLFDLFN